MSMTYLELNNFTRKEEGNKTNNDSYIKLSDYEQKSNNVQKNNIDSAYKAKQGGFISKTQSENNLLKKRSNNHIFRTGITNI